MKRLLIAVGALVAAVMAPLEGLGSQAEAAAWAMRLVGREPGDRGRTLGE